MITRFFQRWFSKKRGPLDDAQLRAALSESKKRREEAQKKIDGMMATLDGCGDHWFIQPIIPINECPPPEEKDGDTPP
jgi:hypothetical protein